MIDERARHQRYLSLERHLGHAEADTLMDLLPSDSWTEVATKTDLQHLRGDMAALEQRMDLRFDAMDERLERRLAQTQSALMRFMAATMVGSMLTMTVILLMAVAFLR